MVNRLIATGLLAIASLWLVACGTGSVGTSGNPARDESHSGAGVRAGNFEVIRYNEAGYPDPSLNSTLQLGLAQKGGQTALTINVRDSVHTDMVAVDVHYDGGSVHPDDVKFFGALGDDDQVLTASFLTQIPGTAAIGQTGINDYKPAAINGAFAQLTFLPGGVRSVSAAGDVHQAADGVGYHVGEQPSNTLADSNDDPGPQDDPNYIPNLQADDNQDATSGHPGYIEVKWTAAWHLGDGNQNKEVEIADLSPLGKFLNENVATNFAALPADYNGDGEVAVSDLSKMGKHLGEGTETYLVEVGDNAVGATQTTVDTLTWESAAPPSEVPPTAAQTPEDLGRVFRTWTVHIDASSTVTLDQLGDIDAAGNNDGKVSFQITPQRGTQKGVTASVEAAAVDTSLPPVRSITVDQVRIRVEGATGGDDDGTFFDDDTTAGSVTANSAVHFSIVGIHGIYSSPVGGGEFDGINNADDDLWPADMTQQDYDDALALAQTTGATDQDPGFVHFSFSNGGAAGFRYRSDWVTFQDPPPYFGDAGDGVVFPDDDPESTGASSEGILTVSLASAPDQDGDPLRTIAFSSYNKIFQIDVTADPNAPVLADPIDLLTGQPATTLTQLEGTKVAQDITTPNTVVDPQGVTLQLLEILPSGAAGDTVNFTYADGANNQGEFFVRTVDPLLNIQAFVSGAAITEGTSYHFTFKDDQGGPWSSLNTPEGLLTTAPAPPAVDLVSVPHNLSKTENDASYTTLRIFLPEPKIRRNPYGQLLALPDPHWQPNDQPAFDDRLKESGQEFFPVMKDFIEYPRLTIVQADTPDAIDASTQSLEFGGSITRSPGYLVVDLVGLTYPDAFDPAINYAYKLFNSNGTAVGQGTFVTQYLRADDGPPIGAGPGTWGVNVFDRLNTPTATLNDLPGLYGNRNVKHSSLSTGTPDVLWFEFKGGYMYAPAGQETANTKAIMEWWEGNGNSNFPASMALDLRAEAVLPNGNFLAVHPVTEADFQTGGGNFIPGSFYIVHLDDPHYAGWDYQYGAGNPDGDENMLFVSEN
jgi:hypothetical protein